MEDKNLKSSYGQLEQDLSEHIQVLYLTQLGHKPNQVYCQVVDKNITITFENPLTQIERLLASSGKQELAEQVRFTIHKALLPQLKALIQEVTGASVTDFLTDSNLETERTTVIAILATPPEVNNYT